MQRADGWGFLSRYRGMGPRASTGQSPLPLSPSPRRIRRGKAERALRWAAGMMGIAKWMPEYAVRPAARHLESESIWYSRATRDQRHGPGPCRTPLALVDVCWAWMHASSRLRPEGRTAAETNNHLASGCGLHLQSPSVSRPGPNPMSARHATEPLGSLDCSENPRTALRCVGCGSASRPGEEEKRKGRRCVIRSPSPCAPRQHSR